MKEQTAKSTVIKLPIQFQAQNYLKRANTMLLDASLSGRVMRWRPMLTTKNANRINRVAKAVQKKLGCGIEYARGVVLGALVLWGMENMDALRGR